MKNEYINELIEQEGWFNKVRLVIGVLLLFLLYPLIKLAWKGEDV